MFHVQEGSVPSSTKTSNSSIYLDDLHTLDSSMSDLFPIKDAVHVATITSLDEDKRF